MGNFFADPFSRRKNLAGGRLLVHLFIDEAGYLLDDFSEAFHVASSCHDAEKVGVARVVNDAAIMQLQDQVLVTFAELVGNFCSCRYPRRQTERELSLA